jgi:PAT family beta-lactamase induction signal transducer AmpG
MAAVLALGASDPVGSPWNTAALALLVTFFSASQDIVIDAYRVERLADSEQGVGASSYIYGYRVGMLVSGAGALLIADHVSWFWTYAAMAATLLVGVVTTLIIREPEGSAFKVLGRRTTVIEQCQAWLQVAFVEPFREFMTRRAWFAILVFILFYKFGDALAGVLSNPFYIQIGFDKTEIAYYAKVLGLGGTLVGVFFGALMVARINILKTLLICGILQALSNLMFVWLAAAGNDTTLLALTIAAENFTGGMGTAAFVAYISGLTNISFTATQFALLTSLASVGRTVFASYSGGVVELVGWIDFFIISTLAAGPGLLLLVWLMANQRRLNAAD